MDAETFNLLPIQMDATTKLISTTTPASSALETELKELNNLHKLLKTIPTPIPPPPVPVDPKRSAQITKMREAGNASFKKAQYPDAVRMYSLAIDMALGRPGWEPSGLVREETSGLYANRAQAHMAMQNWAEGAIDAECSTEMKKVGNAKAWWRRGRCLLETGRLDDAKEWVAQALDFENEEADLLGLKKDVEAAIAKKDGAR